MLIQTSIERWLEMYQMKKQTDRQKGNKQANEENVSCRNYECKVCFEVLSSLLFLFLPTRASRPNQHR
jgi:hypothetical protein